MIDFDTLPSIDLDKSQTEDMWALDRTASEQNPGYVVRVNARTGEQIVRRPKTAIV